MMGAPLYRIGLGAAQFGMAYGRFNTLGMPSDETVAAILEIASEYGLSTIDTAHHYGASEPALGRCGARLRQFEVITKTPRFADGAIGPADAQALRDAFNNSMRALQLPAIHGLMIHHAPNLLAEGGERLYDAMLALKREGRVAHIGVSVYSGELAEEIHARFPVDLVQLPMNLLDQRPLQTGALARLAGAGVKVHVRSAFLQGLLLSDPASLGPHFAAAQPALTALHRAAADACISPAHLALHFLLGIAAIDRVVVGVDSAQQLIQLFGDFPAPPPVDYARFAIDQADILNPSLWPS